MERGGFLPFVLLRLSAVTLCLWAWACAAGDAPAATPKALTPEPGETRLDAQATERVLAEMNRAFQRVPCLRAHITSEVEDDLLGGTKKEEGELFLERPNRLVRRLGLGPAQKLWLLDGDRVLEYSPNLEKVMVKDFSKAPRALALVRAGITLDTKVLREYFDLAVFCTLDPMMTAAMQNLYRVVLTQRAGAKLRLPYDCIQARWTRSYCFLSEIQYVPVAGQGNALKETYSQIRIERAFADKRFLDPLFDSKPRQVDVVPELETEAP